MGLLTAIKTWTTGGEGTETTDGTADRRARCRNCGRYYGADESLCPHCGSGNKILQGAPSGQRPR